MNKIEQIDPEREKPTRIEMTDEEYRDKHLPIRNQPPKIPMKLQMPILEKQIKEKGMHPDEKSTSKSPKSNAKRNSTKLQ